MEAELHFIWGSMNSQKSADLLMKIFNHKKYNKSYLAFKSARDTRDGAFIVSRALSFKEPAILVKEEEVGKMFALTETSKPQFVYVDEVSFMTVGQVEELGMIVDDLHIPVFAYGLMVDFQQNLFPASKKLMEIADIKKELTHQCMFCTKPATQNMRVLNGTPVFEGEVVQVGGNESYHHVCRRCYNKFKKKSKMKLVQSL